MAMRPRKDFIATIGGKRIEFTYDLDDGMVGLCVRRPCVLLKQHRSSKELLDTLVHETLHMSTDSNDEVYVSKTAADIAAVLWAAGWRQQP